MKKIFCDICGTEGAETISGYCLKEGTYQRENERREADICPVCASKIIQNMANNDMAWYIFFDSYDTVKAKWEQVKR